MIHERPRLQGPPNNGLPPPERGGIRFNVTARPPERTTTPTIPRPIEPPPPPPIKKKTVSQPLDDAIIEGFERTPDKPKKPNKIRVLLSRGILAGLVIGAGVWGLNKIRGDNEPTPQAANVDVPNSPTENRLVPRAEAETKKVNPKEIFDNTKTKGIFTEANSVAMTPEEYQETSPRLINGDSVVIPLPIEFPDGQTPSVKFKREKGKMLGGQRHINGRLENGETLSDGTVIVNDVLILDNLPVGSVFLSPWEGEIQFATSSGYKNPDGSLKTAAFTIYTTDAKGNKVTLTMSTVKVKPLIEPSSIEYEEGTNHTKPLTRKPLNLGDPIVKILTTNHDNPYYDGQIMIKALSRVEENGKSRGGAAGIETATTPEGQAIRLDRKSESK